MTGSLVIARLTFTELMRRWLVLALLALTAVVIGLTAWGFARVPSLHLAGSQLGPTEVRSAAGDLLLLVMFMFSFVLALSCSFLAAPAIAGDLEAGLSQGLLARPLRRGELLLGRWLGLALPMTVYTAVSATLEFYLVRWTTGYFPSQPVAAEAALAAEGLVMLTFTLALSTRISAITAGVISVIAFGTMWLGGVAGAFGEVFNNAAISAVGSVTHMLLPTDGLWRAAVYAMQPRSVSGPVSAGLNSTFQAAAGPTTAYLAWVGVWLALVVGLALVSFQRREV